MLVEVCCNSLESAINAQKGGADRIELCVELGVGGITPSHGMIKLVRKALTIPIHVLIRPRSGHFTYSESEFEVMQADIQFCKQTGVEGIVSGVLNSNCSLDVERIQRLAEWAKPMSFTFHRAFDWVPDQRNALKQLEDLGVQTVLTSGKEASAESGLDTLKELNKIAEQVKIMPGGGVDINNCNLFKNAGFQAIHLSGSLFKNAIDTDGLLSMNSDKHLNQDKVALTSADIIFNVVQSVK